MAQLYQHTTAFDIGTLQASSIHTLHYEQYGKADGKPVMYLHGGPGTGISFANIKMFDPEVYRVVLLDQRGAGKSRPAGEIRENSSQDLVADIEKLRNKLGIKKWHMVYGGSWSSSLGLLYAQAHPQAVGLLVMWGIDACRKEDIDSQFHSLAGKIFPEEFERFLGHLPENRRHEPVAAYYDLLRSGDPNISGPAAKAWNRWDWCTIGPLKQGQHDYTDLEDETWCLQRALLETHYFFYDGFIQDGEILWPENVNKIRHIPCSMVQGRFDIVCPPKTAWDLHKLWPEAKLYMVSTAGHSASELFTELKQICDDYRELDLTSEPGSGFSKDSPDRNLRPVRCKVKDPEPTRFKLKWMSHLGDDVLLRA